ncbi:MAG: hypothetical protein JW997_05250 [Actinobacteria bacterium]|nr:hypothetical protein [Actinomycetota bacterium]
MKAKKSLNRKKPAKAIYVFTSLIICILAFLIVFSAAACRKKAASESETATGSTAIATEANETEPATATETEATTAAQTESATEPAEEVPDEITSLIKKADDYYAEGDYGLARSNYRKAEIAVNDSGLSDQEKQKLIDSFNSKYEECKDIISTASMHYANAMQLIYETRYEEAKTELESALAIYPKYDEAQKAYDNLKTLMGLQ